MTTDTACRIASFHDQRDRDVLALSDMEPSASTFPAFSTAIPGPIPARRVEARRRWQDPGFRPRCRRAYRSDAPVPAGQRPDFHARPAEYLGEPDRPLFVEATFVDLTGRERIKVTQGDLTAKGEACRRPRQTFVRAETLFLRTRGPQARRNLRFRSHRRLRPDCRDRPAFACRPGKGGKALQTGGVCLCWHGESSGQALSRDRPLGDSGGPWRQSLGIRDTGARS